MSSTQANQQQYVTDSIWNQDLERDACGIGMIVNIDSSADYRVLDDALNIVEKLEHRAGKDATGQVGDGVGILLQISHSFFKKSAESAGIQIGEKGDYGIGMFFLPQDKLKRTFAKRMLEVILEKSIVMIYNHSCNKVAYCSWSTEITS